MAHHDVPVGLWAVQSTSLHMDDFMQATTPAPALHELPEEIFVHTAALV